MSSSSIHQPLLFNNNHASHVEILIPHPPNNSVHCSLFTVRLLLNSCSNVRGEPRNEKSKEGAVRARLHLSAASASSTGYAIPTLFTCLCTLNNAALILNFNAKIDISRNEIWTLNIIFDPCI
uniref:Uncharacterized protein n=1 Tax=Glossina palpalis gambiensis TaxID=67801 RepID=A0A1B0BVH4_9MUSC